MPQTPVDFTNIFIRPPGDLIYYLAVVALSQAGFFMALGQRLRRPAARAPGRYMLATLGVFCAWALLMLGAMVALFSSQPADAILPPLERVVQVTTILLLKWAYLTADDAQWGRTPNLILIGLLLLLVVGYIITGVNWAAIYTRTDFNLSVYGVTWTFVPAVLTVLALTLTLVYFRRVVDAPLKLVYFVVLLLGYAGALVQTAQGNIIGDYSGPIRLAFLASLLVLPALIYRMVVGVLEAEADAEIPAPAPSPALPSLPPPRVEPPPPPERPTAERESAQLMRALGMILENATLETIPEQIVLAAMNILRADIGALLTTPAASYADIQWGRDKVMDRTITSLSINLDEQPTLVNAIERRQQRPLFTDRNADELHDLYARLDIESVGPTYFQPLVAENELLAILVIGMPYSGRELLDPEKELLRGIGIIAARLLALSRAAKQARADYTVIEALKHGATLDDLENDHVLAVWQEVSAELTAARDQIMQLSNQVTQLKIELDYERSRVASELDDTEESQTISQRIVALNDEHQRLIEERDRLASRLREAETALLGAVSTDNEAMFKSMIEAMRREKDELTLQRDRLSAQLMEMRGTTTQPQVVQEMLEQMTQETAQLALDREQLTSRLNDIELQLRALGIGDGAAGVTQLIGRLFEQRATLQTRAESLKLERDTLMTERAQFEDAIAREQERDQQLQTLQAQIGHLAADREFAMKQREKFRLERDDLLARQEALREQQARFLAEIAGYEQELTEAHEDEKALREQLQAVNEERRELTSERDRLLARLKALEHERDQLVARTQGERERLEELGADSIGSLTQMIDELSTQRAELERELSEAQSALSAADDRLEALQKRMAQSPAQPQVVYRPDNPELLLGMVQELRTPMTSIVGYVDLMLNESAGILGEMQRKFLQRVSANITRLASMIEDLTRISTLDAGQFNLTPEAVDVVEIIEDAITAASVQLREKGLTLNLSLEDEATPVRADRDAVSQIIGQLLTNAYLASPPGSEIIVIARRQPDADERSAGEVMFVSIEDRGGGIAPEDQARVFARKYRAENPLIQGLGDTGVGLAVAKALVEAHGGEIWLETRAGVGSAFNFTLPLELVAEAER